jgi:diacylglycerol O-acyltransferase
MDRAFFLLETEQRPMNVGLLFVVAPRRASRDQPCDELVRRMLRCPVGPPFNHVLAPGPWPRLVERERIDPAEQLFRHRLPAGSDLQTLFAQVCAIHSRRLDRARPLWEMHVFDGLAHGRGALYFKSHHGLLDGLGFIEVIRRTVSRRPGSSTPQAIWRGLPVPVDGESVAPVVRRPVPGTLELLRASLATARTVNDLGRLLWHVGLRDLGLGRGLAAPFVSTPNVLKAPPSPNRVMGHCALPLARVRAIARAGDAKVNDVLLATLDLALGRYLRQHGMQADKPLVADMPIALHDGVGAGNRITVLQVPLGRPGGTPVERLADVVRETRTVKDEVRSLVPDSLFLYSIAEHALASAIEALNLDELPMLANAVISNPTGLRERVHFNGAPVELALPVSVVAHHQVLNVTVSNYGSELHVTFIAQREALPDVTRLADETVRALRDLARSVLCDGRPRRQAGARRTANTVDAALH